MKDIVPAKAIVPDCDNMDDETFLKHCAKRHEKDYPDAKHLPFTPRSVDNGWMEAYREFHNRVHAISVFKDHDHEHAEYEEEA